MLGVCYDGFGLLNKYTQCCHNSSQKMEYQSMPSHGSFQKLPIGPSRSIQVFSTLKQVFLDQNFELYEINEIFQNQVFLDQNFEIYEISEVFPK